MPSLQASLAVAALAAVLSVASASDSLVLAGGVTLVVLLFTLGAVSPAEVPSARPAAAVASAAGLGALLWTSLDQTSDLTPIGAMLGPALVLAIVVQLWRRDGRPAMTVSLAFAVTACVLAVLPVTWVALRESTDGVYSVGLALLGVGAVGLTEALPMSRAARRALGVLAAAVGAGALVVTVSRVSEAVPAVSALVVTTFSGLMAAIAFAVADRLAAEFPTAAATPIPVPAGGELGSASQAAPETTAGEALDLADEAPPARRGSMTFLPLRISLPFIAAAPTAYVLGRIFVT